MRTLNRIYAFLFGYFWLPCPNCGDMFGGHESSFKSKIVDGHAYCMCKKCGDNPNIPDEIKAQQQKWLENKIAAITKANNKRVCVHSATQEKI